MANVSWSWSHLAYGRLVPIIHRPRHRREDATVGGTACTPTVIPAKRGPRSLANCRGASSRARAGTQSRMRQLTFAWPWVPGLAALARDDIGGLRIISSTSYPGRARPSLHRRGQLDPDEHL